MNMDSLSPELAARIKTGIPLAAAVTLIVFSPVLIVGLVVIVFAVIGSGELTSMLSKKEITLPEWFLPGCALLMGLGALGGSNGLHGMLLVCAAGWMFQQLLFSSEKSFSGKNLLGFGLFGMLLTGWSLSHMILIKDLENGTALVFLLLFVISLSDIFAYFGGKHFGSIPLAPSISPKKTWEGSLIGAGVSALFAGLYVELVLDYFWLTGILLGLVTAAAGQLGDLVESRIKRLCEVKDSGSLLPGHGGILDRVDGYLIAAPLFYYLILLG